MNSIACANERIPRRARKSAFLGIVYFAHCQKILACRGSLKRNNPSCYKYLPKNFRTGKAEQSEFEEEFISN